MAFSKDILRLDCAAEAGRISDFIAHNVRELKRDGIVVGLSGGIDSALAAALSVKAVGKEKVLGLILPEKESNPVSAEYAEEHARQLGIETLTVDITPTLETLGTYEKRDQIVKSIFPGYHEECKIKITLPGNLLDKDALNFFTLYMDDGTGDIKKARLKKNNYLVCGTTNKSETVQGFFVQYGDGGVDIEPLAHLYKVQVYQVAGYLDVSEAIIRREPSPDTYTFTVSDEEFYYRIPREKLDLLLYAWENEIEMPLICEVMDLQEEQVKRAFRDFVSKYNATKHMRQLPPTLD